MNAYIVEFILNSVKNSTKGEILRCLNKATIIIFDNKSVIVANDTYVYYVSCLLNTKDTLKWYFTYKHLLKGKKSYTKNQKILKVMAKKVLGVSKDNSWEFIIK